MLKRVLVPVLAALLVAACSPMQHVTKNDDALHAKNSWDLNYAIMQAADRSDNIEIGISAGVAELDARPDNDEARILLARFQTKARRPEQALYTLSQLAAGHKDSVAARIERARAYIASGRMDEARADLEAIGTAPAEYDREKRRLLAVTEDVAGNHAKAQELYRALLAEREDAPVRFNFGRSLITTRNYPQAANVLLPLTENARYPQARILAAGAFLKSGNKTAARNLLEGYLSRMEIDELLEKGVAK